MAIYSGYCSKVCKIPPVAYWFLRPHAHDNLQKINHQHPHNMPIEQSKSTTTLSAKDASSSSTISKNHSSHIQPDISMHVLTLEEREAGGYKRARLHPDKTWEISNLNIMLQAETLQFPTSDPIRRRTRPLFAPSPPALGGGLRDCLPINLPLISTFQPRLWIMLSLSLIVHHFHR